MVCHAEWRPSRCWRWHVVRPHPVRGQSLLDHPVHLGVAGQPEWDSFRSSPPTGDALTLTFDARTND